MGFLSGGPVPGSPAFQTFKGPNVPQANSTRVPITFQGTPTPGESITFTVGTDVTSVQPTSVVYKVTASDTLATIATHVATALTAAIAVAGSPWNADFTASAATGTTVNNAIKTGVSLATLSIAVNLDPHSQLAVLPMHYPETVSTTATEVTALKTFPYCTASGTMRVYKGQLISVSNDVARDMIAQGLAE